MANRLPRGPTNLALQFAGSSPPQVRSSVYGAGATGSVVGRSESRVGAALGFLLKTGDVLLGAQRFGTTVTYVTTRVFRAPTSIRVGGTPYALTVYNEPSPEPLLNGFSVLVRHLSISVPAEAWFPFGHILSIE